MSAAPEIALLTAASPFAAVRPAGAPPSGPLTLGTLSRRLRTLAAAPERWWGQVRFDPGRSVLIEVEDQPEYGAWLVVMPPGDIGRPCDCDVATLIAGEAAEGGAALYPGTALNPGTALYPGTALRPGAALHPGRVRVHGNRHWLRGHGAGYSISLHARTVPGRVPEAGFSAAEFAASREFAIQRPASFG